MERFEDVAVRLVIHSIATCFFYRVPTISAVLSNGVPNSKGPGREYSSPDLRYAMQLSGSGGTASPDSQRLPVLVWLYRDSQRSALARFEPRPPRKFREGWR